MSPPLQLTGLRPLGSLRAAHSVIALGVDCAGVLPPASLLLHHSQGLAAWQPMMSLHYVSTVQVCCLLPASSSITHLAAGSGHPVSEHELSTVQLRCLSPNFSSFPRLTTGQGSPQRVRVCLFPLCLSVPASCMSPPPSLSWQLGRATTSVCLLPMRWCADGTQLTLDMPPASIFHSPLLGSMAVMPSDWASLSVCAYCFARHPDM